MTTTEASSVLHGCKLSSLDAAASAQYLDWLRGGATEPDKATDLIWALAHCDDGVTWGRYDATVKTWRLGCQVAPKVSPPIHRESLQELRLFGESGEVLIWRTHDGLCGRLLEESEPDMEPSDTSNPLRPSEDARILRGLRVVAQHAHDFTHVVDGAGAEQALPLAVDNKQLQSGQVRICVRHYYEADAETGAVRIAATRLVRLTLGGAHGD